MSASTTLNELAKVFGFSELSDQETRVHIDDLKGDIIMRYNTLAGVILTSVEDVTSHFKQLLRGGRVSICDHKGYFHLRIFRDPLTGGPGLAYLLQHETYLWGAQGAFLSKVTYPRTNIYSHSTHAIAEISTGRP